MANLTTTTNLIREWAYQRNLISALNVNKQTLKVVEEVGELAQAINNNDMIALIDAIGDVYVTLVILSEDCGLKVEKCIQSAYEEIKDRTGKTINGVFFKD
jgi:NTP pyrophosphatase (non-canonical NTP hydrolase)